MRSCIREHPFVPSILDKWVVSFRPRRLYSVSKDPWLQSGSYLTSLLKMCNDTSSWSLLYHSGSSSELDVHEGQMVSTKFYGVLLEENFQTTQDSSSYLIFYVVSDDFRFVVLSITSSYATKIPSFSRFIHWPAEKKGQWSCQVDATWKTKMTVWLKLDFLEKNSTHVVYFIVFDSFLITRK